MKRVKELFKRIEKRPRLYHGEQYSWAALNLKSWISEHAKQWPDLSVKELEEIWEIKSVWVLPPKQSEEEVIRYKQKREEVFKNLYFIHPSEMRQPDEDHYESLLATTLPLNLDSFGRPTEALRALEETPLRVWEQGARGIPFKLD